MNVLRLRDDPDGLEVAVAAADDRGVPVCFKGGTSLSKVYGLIRRFSEDVDVLAVLRNDDTAGARHRILKALCAGAAEATGLGPIPVGDKSSKGDKRAIAPRVIALG